MSPPLITISHPRRIDWVSYTQPIPSTTVVNLDEDGVSAKVFGEILGFSVGWDAEAVAPVSKEDFLRAKTMTDLIFSKGDLATKVFLAEFQALYLPALFRTFHCNTIGDFNAIDQDLFAYYCDLVGEAATLPYGYRFAREHLRENTRFQLSVALKVMDATDWREELSHPIFLSLFPVLQLDLPSLVLRSLRRSPDPRYNKSIAGLISNLEAYQEPSRMLRAEGAMEYVTLLNRSWLNSGKKKAEENGLRRAVDAYENSCAAKDEMGAPCLEKEVRACSKCKVVQYCSEEHQVSHWKDHKLVCFAPTW